MDNNVWILIAFGAYLVVMLTVGALYATSSKNAADYFLGGRGMGGWVVALSAQASDMSGWLLMGLPGAIYVAGTGEIWIAVGLFLGTVFNWLVISKRLYRYTIRANNALTLPEYFMNRFHDKKKILLIISSVTIVIFFLVYTASALAAGGKLFNVVFDVDYHIALTIGAIVILVYTFLGGFKAVCVTDFIQGMIMVIGLMAVPIIAVIIIGADNVSAALDASGVAGGAASFLNPLEDGGKDLTAATIISGLAWGLGYCGMPHILVRFMAVRNEKELNKSKLIGIVWVAISLVFACIIGVVGRAYLFNENGTVLGVTGGTSENVFIEMIKTIFTSNITVPFIGGIFLCGILAAIMSTADSQLLITASSVSQDIYKGVINKNASDKKVLGFSRIAVIIVAVLAFLIAWDPESSVMGLVSNAWAGLGAAFGPVVLMSLFWRRTNLAGAVSGIVTGALTVIVWDYIKFGGSTLGTSTGLYSLAVGFPLSLLVIFIVSRLTKAPDDEILQEFDDVVEGKIGTEG